MPYAGLVCMSAGVSSLVMYVLLHHGRNSDKALH